MSVKDNELIRAQNILNLRNKLSAEMKRRGLAIPKFTDGVATNAIVLTEQTQEIKSGLHKINSSLKFNNDDPLIKNKSYVKKEDINEAEAYIEALKNKPKIGADSGCNGSCMGLCQSCTGTCVGGCTSCTSCSGCQGCSGCSSCSMSCSWGGCGHG